MMWKRSVAAHATLGALCFLLVAARPVGAPGEELPQDLQPVLNVYVLPGFDTRDFQGAASASWPLAREWHGAWVTADSDESCGTGVQAPAANFPDAPHAAAVWKVEARLASVEGETATFDLRWIRTVSNPSWAPTKTAEQRLTLRDGSTGIVDMVRVDGPETRGCGGAAVALRLTFKPRTAVQVAGFEYDVWLVDRSADGTEQIRHAVTGGRQGQPAAFAFQPLPFDQAGIPQLSADAPITMNVSGQLVAHAREDATIDLAVDMTQEFGFRRGGWSGTGGRRRLSVRPGETVEFQVMRRNNAQVPQRLREHRTAIRVTVKRAW